ncbi:VWA domain-containing protein [Spirilliplanes yamanashiensis]|uniref:VWFA domain-containing protein n=1 Tax=Spirilliplanes yamanashiensis TaxID=42233 RepID=A0A8J4DM71_9ACTN|nr:VWA domain-containing protein [Spirilliplanes yamanashiensis]MDP9816323.1 hypothetical protein [Spirilliplanes yamanashiensis]GIJ05850.1 hypothetical protein Sya03_52020 [Spirilliplanes yamanashiensis]
MALVVVLAGSWLGYQQLNKPACTGSVRLTVAAAAEIVPAIQSTAASWEAGGANVAGTCVKVDVSSINPATMAAAIASQHGVTLTGLGQGSGAIRPPDVWIPDSSTWLLRLRQEAPGFVPTDGRSIANSPVVVAMPEPVAQRVGWPDKKLGWTDLLQQMSTGTGLRTGIVDPTRDAAGLAGLLALGQATGGSAGGAAAQNAATGALRTLAQASSALRDDLLEKFPRSTDPADIASALNAAPLSEEDVVAYNAEQPPIKLAALYLDPAPPALNYPFAVLPEADAPRQAAADGLHTALSSAAFRDALAGRGLRAADGSTGAGFAAPAGAPAASPSVAASSAPPSGGAAAGGPDAGAISRALGSWAAITLPGRVLAVFDVSGSMLTTVPSARNATRAQVTQAAARQGLSLFDDKWAVGVWLFSTELRGKQDWREIVPISPLSAKRAELEASVAQIVPKRGGATGLYDTLLAAYKNVQETWQGGRINSVILFTDGKNEDADSISRGALISELTKIKDPNRPVRVVIIGIGGEVDRKELEAIAEPTGGGVFTVEDPARMGEIFLEAISTRSGASR